MNDNFPKQIFIVIDAPEHNDDEEVMLAHTEISALSAPNQTRSIARYVLAGSGTVENRSTYTETESTEE